MITISNVEQALIDKYGFVVTTTNGGSYVVRDPHNKKAGKREGGNLLALLYNARDARHELEQNKPSGQSKPKKAPQNAAPTAAVSEPAPSEAAPVAEPSETPTAPATTDATREKQPAKSRRQSTRRAPADWKTGRVGMLILRHPDKTPEQILDMAKEQGIDTTKMTVIGLHRYFNLCMTLLAELAREKAAANTDARADA